MFKKKVKSGVDLNSLLEENKKLKVELKVKDDLIDSYRKKIKELSYSVEAKDNSLSRLISLSSDIAFNIDCKIQKLYDMVSNISINSKDELIDTSESPEDLCDSEDCSEMSDDTSESSESCEDFDISFDDSENLKLIKFNADSNDYLSSDEVKDLGVKKPKLYRFINDDKKMTTSRDELSLYSANFTLSLNNSEFYPCRAYLYASKDNVHDLFETYLKKFFSSSDTRCLMKKFNCDSGLIQVSGDMTNAHQVLHSSYKKFINNIPERIFLVFDFT